MDDIIELHNDRIAFAHVVKPYQSVSDKTKEYSILPIIEIAIEVENPWSAARGIATKKTSLGARIMEKRH